MPLNYGGDIGEPEVATFMDQQPGRFALGISPLSASASGRRSSAICSPAALSLL